MSKKATIALGQANPVLGAGLRQAVVAAARPGGAAFLNASAWLIASLFPSKWWYRLILGLSRALSPVMRLRARDVTNNSLHEAYLLTRMISLLAGKGCFEIPYRIVGADILGGLPEKAGVVFCSAHMPLVNLGLRAVLERGHRVHGVLAAHPPADGLMQAPGLAMGVPIVITDSTVLLKVRRALTRGERLFGLVDTRLGCDYSPNLLKLAGKTKSQVVFFSTELQRDGCIDVRFLRPPDPFCRTDAGIHANLKLLHAEIRGILERPSRC